jgi:DNA ligase-1
MSDDTPFAAFVSLCEGLAGTKKRNEKMELVSQFLRSLGCAELEAGARFVIGRPLPEPDDSTLDVSWQTLVKTEPPVRESGRPKESLLISDVRETFTRLAACSGPGSQERRRALLEALFSRATPLEARWLRHIIFREMQHGVGEGVMLDAIGRAAGVEPALVKRAMMFLGDVGQVARIAVCEGRQALEEVGFSVGHPIQPMLAQLAETAEKAIEEHGGRSAFEFKLDGARVQIHIHEGGTEIFSRRLSDVTASLPDIVALVGKGVRARDAVIEGEVVAERPDGKPLPFQELMRRFRRVHEIEAMVEEVPVRLYLFDLLYLDGELLIDRSYAERWDRLRGIVNPELLAERIVSGDGEEAKAFLQSALGAGHEGLMAKELDSPYTPGARGKKWLKIKPADYLDLVIVAAEWGYGRRTGWLSNYHLAARSEEGGEFDMIGKTFKGLTDEQFREMTQRLLERKVRERRGTVYVRPEIVVEVAYNEIQRSPRYASGYSLRFARIKSIRYDKGPQQADTIERVAELFGRQFERKGR